MANKISKNKKGDFTIGQIDSTDSLFVINHFSYLQLINYYLIIFMVKQSYYFYYLIN